MPSAALRLFIAAELPDGIKESLQLEQQSLRQGSHPVRWVQPLGMHLTLQFLGPVEPPREAGILQALAQVASSHAPLTLGVAGLGAFPHARRPRVLWAGIHGDTQALADLQKAVALAMRPLGFPLEARPFSPHLTLGRVQEGASRDEAERLGQAVQGRTYDPGLEWQVGEIKLVQSELLPGGARYTVRGAFPLLKRP